jgi:hypothetical protein
MLFGESGLLIDFALWLWMINASLMLWFNTLLIIMKLVTYEDDDI